MRRSAALLADIHPAKPKPGSSGTPGLRQGIVLVVLVVSYPALILQRARPASDRAGLLSFVPGGTGALCESMRYATRQNREVRLHFCVAPLGLKFFSSTTHPSRLAWRPPSGWANLWSRLRRLGHGLGKSMLCPECICRDRSTAEGGCATWAWSRRRGRLRFIINPGHALMRSCQLLFADCQLLH